MLSPVCLHVFFESQLSNNLLVNKNQNNQTEMQNWQQVSMRAQLSSTRIEIHWVKSSTNDALYFYTRRKTLKSNYQFETKTQRSNSNQRSENCESQKHSVRQQTQNKNNFNRVQGKGQP